MLSGTLQGHLASLKTTHLRCKRKHFNPKMQFSMHILMKDRALELVSEKYAFEQVPKDIFASLCLIFIEKKSERDRDITGTGVNEVRNME